MAVREPKSMPAPCKRMISSTPASAPGRDCRARAARTGHRTVACILRRKEVIQPHLPVRLPCYDLVPITSLTLDGSPQKG